MAVPRTSIASLGPPPIRAVAEPAGQASPPVTAQAARPAMARVARLTVFGLGIAGVLPPLAFTARPGELGLIGGVPVAIALTGLLILAPAFVGLVAAVRPRLRARELPRPRRQGTRAGGAAGLCRRTGGPLRLCRRGIWRNGRGLPDRRRARS